VKNGKMEDYFQTISPNNFINWKVFDDDAQILRFMNNLQEFSRTRSIGEKKVQKKK
jgi:hypothetical protein